MRHQTIARLALLGCLWACKVTPPEGVYRCQQSADCPEGQVCNTETARCVGSRGLASTRKAVGTQDVPVGTGGRAGASGGKPDATEESLAGRGGQDAGGMRAPEAGREAPAGSAARPEAGSGGEVAKPDAGSCTPEAERCDAIDNDCDQRIDEALSEACGSSTGECRPGTHQCERGRWSACNGEVAPRAEQCDGLDNDCNGKPDDAPECALRWRAVSVSPGPTKREQSAFGYDSDRKLFVIHGGFWENMGTADTWAFDVTSDTWRQLSDTGPSPRRDHAMAYDARRKSFVLYGGFTGKVGLRDTWELDGQTWRERPTDHVPPDRSLHAMVYDTARQRVVMFGGFVNGAVTAQTWEYDGVDWQERAISGPPARRSPALTYDAEHKRVLMFGGSPEWGDADRVTTGFNDLWAYDGTSWQQLTATEPPRARWFTHLIWHPLRKVAFLYGGVQMQTNLKDTYELDGTRWRDRSGEVGAPDASYSASIVYDPVKDRLLSFGGTTAANEHTDAVWELR